jgi:8-oxo-dGTP diphosphatase
VTSISSSGIVIVNGTVLLVRHTYGMLKGRLLIPGGRLDEGELPNEVATREVLEESSVTCTADRLYAVRCRPESIWFAFLCSYVSGEPYPDGRETDRALFMDIDEAVEHPDVTDTMKMLFRAYQDHPASGLGASDYVSPNFTDSRYLLYL